MEETKQGLLQGKGATLGAHTLHYEMEDRVMLRVLQDRANDRGEHPWLICDLKDSLTFSEGWKLVCRIGGALVRDGYEGSHVALLMRNQIEFMPSMHGTHAARGVAIPLNAESRGAHLKHMITKGDASVIIVRDEFLERITDLDDIGLVTKIIVVGKAPEIQKIHKAEVVSFEKWIDGVNPELPGELPNWDETAVIQFTSGTTGLAKGAICTHHYFYLASAILTDSLERSQDDILFTPLPAFHVAALHFVANLSIHAGCTGHLLSKFSPSKYFEQAAQAKATFSIILGPMAVMIEKRTENVPEHCLEVIFCVPPPPGIENFEQRFNIELLWQSFGMTEIIPLPAPRHLLSDYPPGTLGHPAQWVEYGVVDDNDRLLPPNEIGELVFRTLIPNAMTTGYYKDPEITVEAFRNFMFHTGDLAFYDQNGAVLYKGRKQDRIRRRGEMVGAMEVEFIVLTNPNVLEAAVYGVPSELGEEDIKLDIVSSKDIDLNELRIWCEENLPRYMVPRYIEKRDSFPKTPSERIEKHKLQDQPLTRPEVADFEGNK